MKLSSSTFIVLYIHHSKEAIEPDFHVQLFLMLSKIIVTLRSVDETLVYDLIQMKSIELCAHVVLFAMLYKLILF